MERYGPAEGPQSDPPTNLEGETGLEEPVWQLGLGGEPYPERPGEPDCIYYLRTGSCGYGDRCRFNHPRSRPPVPGRGRFGGREYPERTSQPVCEYFVKAGTCKFGNTCKYHHPRQAAGSVSPFALNIYGYPLRPGEKECSYYVKTGQCKFGMSCRFHHPQPANLQVPTATPAAVPPAPVASSTVYSPAQNPPALAPAPQQYGTMTSNWPLLKPHMMPGSYVQGPYGPMLFSPGVFPLPGWASYPVPNTLATSTDHSAFGGGQLYGITQLSPSAAAYTGTYPATPSSAGPSSSFSKEYSFPQRPGQPDCQYYLKTGDCKFGTSCKYHHPAEWVVPETSSALSPMGLPLRTGTSTCSYYAQHGVCKFGPTCKFDHPMGAFSYSLSTSLSDIPLVPHPVGSSIGVLAPSSSSDLRVELISGSNRDCPPMSSMITVSSGSGGSILSKSRSVSQSGVQQSHHSPSSSSNDSAGHGVAPS